MILVVLLGMWPGGSISTLQAANSTQITFSATGGTFNYTVAPPGFSGDDVFGFWVWCSGPSGTTPYQGTCDGSMYFYGISSATLPVQGTVIQAAAGSYQMTVWRPQNTPYQIQCQLTNDAPAASGPNNTINVSCAAPQGAATVTNAVVNISR